MVGSIVLGIAAVVLLAIPLLFLIQVFNLEKD